MLRRLKSSINWLLARSVDRYIERRLRRGYVVFGDRDRLTLAPKVQPYGVHFNTSSGTITVHQNAFFGFGAMIVTGTHDIQKFGEARCQSIPSGGNDIVIHEGAWIATSAVVLGPCVVGAHAVVAAGAVVTKDVAPYTVVAGVPARQIRVLDPDRV